jgi:hypothetical protein
MSGWQMQMGSSGNGMRLNVSRPGRAKLRDPERPSRTQYAGAIAPNKSFHGHARKLVAPCISRRSHSGAMSKPIRPSRRVELELEDHPRKIPLVTQ